jgi:hypothetical protein
VRVQTTATWCGLPCASAQLTIAAEVPAAWEREVPAAWERGASSRAGKKSGRGHTGKGTPADYNVEHQEVFVTIFGTQPLREPVRAHSSMHGDANVAKPPLVSAGFVGGAQRGDAGGGKGAATPFLPRPSASSIELQKGIELFDKVNAGNGEDEASNEAFASIFAVRVGDDG